MLCFDCRVVNNESWYQKMSALDFVCGLGRNFRIGSMLSRTAVATRLKSESGLSFTEFAYQLFQANDWWQLYKEHDCRFQVQLLLLIVCLCL